MSSLPLQLPCLVSEVDRLEREVRDLDRDVQREEAQAAVDGEIISRLLEKEKKVRQEVSDITQDTLEWEYRERCLAQAIECSYKSLEFYRWKEAEGNTRLDREIKKTDDLFISLKFHVDRFQKKYDESMEQIGQLPGFDQMREIEEKKEKLAEMEEENKKLKKEIEEAKIMRTRDWLRFQKSCIFLAMKGKKAWETFREMETLRAIKESTSPSNEDNPIDDQIDEMKNLDEGGRNETLPGNNSPASCETSMAESSQESSLILGLSGRVEASEASTVSPPAELKQVSIEIPILTPQIHSLILSPESDPSPVSTPKKSSPAPKSRPSSTLALGSSIISSLRGKFRDRDSPKKESKIKIKSSQSSEASDSEEPKPKDRQGPQASVLSPRIKKLKFGLPNFLFKKKFPHDITKVSAEVVGEQSEGSSADKIKPRTAGREVLSRRSLDQIQTEGSSFKKPAPVTLPRPRRESSLPSLPMSSLQPILPTIDSLLVPEENPVTSEVEARDLPEEKVSASTMEDIDVRKSVSELASPHEFLESPRGGEDFFNKYKYNFTNIIF